MKSPIYDRLCAYRAKNRISFAMPSHKGGRGLCSDLLSLDVTELPDTVDLLHPDKATDESLSLLSKLYKSDQSFILTCGSTVAVHAMICSALKHGDTLLAASDCHMSVINICSLLGINLRFIPKEYDEKSGIPTRTKKVSEYLKKYPDIKACIVTSPNYFGVCSDIENLAKECHAFNIPLLVDEAHGAHFVASDDFPKNAMELGADISCQSAHKTLTALTGGAYLHIKSNLIEYKKLKKALCALHTSSPSYPIVSSAEKAFSELDREAWNRWCSICAKIKRTIRKETLVRFLENDDPTRFVAVFDAYNISGFEIAQILSEKYNIDVEMSTETAIVLITTPFNTESEMNIFTKAIKEITAGLDARNESISCFIPPCTDELAKPDLFASSKPVLLKDSASMICADIITVYPPGIPVLYGGSVISQKAIEYITFAKNHGALITGIQGDYINIVEEEI